MTFQEPFGMIAIGARESEVSRLRTPKGMYSLWRNEELGPVGLGGVGAGFHLGLPLLIGQTT